MTEVNRTRLMRGRFGLYSSAALCVALLVWAGFVYEPSPDPAQRLSAARVYTQLRAFDLARSEVEDVLDENPTDVEAALWLAYIEEAEGHPGQAVAIYRDVLGRVDDRELRRSITQSMAANCLKSGRPRSARRAARRLVDETPDDPVGWMLEALSCYQLGDDKSFLDKASHAFRLNPTHPVFRLSPAAILPKGLRRDAYETIASGLGLGWIQWSRARGK